MTTGWRAFWRGFWYGIDCIAIGTNHANSVATGPVDHPANYPPRGTDRPRGRKSSVCRFCGGAGEVDIDGHNDWRTCPDCDDGES